MVIVVVRVMEWYVSGVEMILGHSGGGIHGVVGVDSGSQGGHMSYYRLMVVLKVVEKVEVMIK